MVVQVGEEVAVLLKALCKPKPVIAFERLHLRGHYRFDLAHAPHPTVGCLWPLTTTATDKRPLVSRDRK